jgi:hypothetical protein
VSFAGRVEAKMTVPSGGAAVSASVNGGSATTATVPAASYYLTAAGGVSGLIATLQTQLQVVSGGFTVTRSSTTGLVTIAHSTLPSAVNFTSTTLRDILGFERDFDYPQTAAQMATAVGYGTWSAGYLCNEASGNLSSVFGTPATLTASGSPTYSNAGARGGSDKAIGFDATSEYFTGGNVFDVGAGADLAIAWVGKFSALPGGADFRSLFGKAANQNDGWSITIEGATPAIRFFVGTGAGFQNAQVSTAAAFHIGEPFVAIAALDRATNRMNFGIRSLTTGNVSVAGQTVVSSVDVSTEDFKVGANAYLSAWVNHQISALYIAHGTGAASGLSANLSTALSSIATSMLSQTGTKQARGLWFPDCPVNLEGDPERAPKASDLVTQQTPTGVLYGLVGNTWRRHRSVLWSHVPLASTWESETTYDNASWEYFFNETQLGLGSTWFTPVSPVQIYDHNGTVVGIDYNSGAGVSGWQMKGVTSIEPTPSVPGWNGLWRIEIPELVSGG